MRIEPRTAAACFLSACLGWTTLAAGEQQPPAPQVEVKTTQEAKGYRVLTDEEYRKLTEIPTRPVRSPVTGQIVHMPTADPVSDDVDSDLCPHPIGKVQFYSPIVLCPFSGFAAYQQDFQKPLSAEDRAWVSRTLTPRLRKELADLVGDVKATPQQVMDFFNNQQHLPDTLRCENALAFYTYKNAPAPVRARLAWLCAWSYRRETCSTIEGPYLMEPLREVVRILNEDKNREKDLQDRINKLAALYRDPRLGHCQKQIVGLTLAGDYARLGTPGWAAACLQSVRQACKDPKPWLDGVAGPENQRMEIANLQRAAIDVIAEQRLQYLQKEREYLQMAANLLRDSLNDKRYQYPAEKAPFFVYLIGEFERRAERFGPAREWLRGASLLLTERQEPDYASESLHLLQEYLSRRGARPETTFTMSEPDRRLLGMTVQRLRAAAASAAKAPGQPQEEIRSSIPAQMPQVQGNRQQLPIPPLPNR